MALLTQILLGDTELGAEHGIVRAAQAQRLIDLAQAERSIASRIEDISARAQAAADGLVASAQAQARAVLEAADARVDAAYRQAFADGERRAATEWHERQAALADANAGQLRAMHERLAEVVTTAVERIVHTEGRAALFQRALKCVQSLAKDGSALTLRVSASDRESAGASVAALLAQHGGELAVNVVADSALAPGSCIFESDTGVLDASLNTQLHALRAAMGRAARRAIDAVDRAAPADPGPASEPLP